MTDATGHFRVRHAACGTFRRLTLLAPALVAVRRGTKSLGLADGGRLDVPEGWVVGLSAGMTVDVTNEAPPGQPYLADVIAFDPDLLARRPPLPLPAHGAAWLTPEFEACLARCIHLIDTRAPVPAAIRDHALGELLVWLESSGVQLTTERAGGLGGAIRALIAADPARDWTMEALVAALADRGQAMSAPTLRRRLAQRGTSLTDLLIDTRMSLALDRLQTTDLSVGRIALECGYGSPSRFAVRFRARFGVSPSELRGHERRNDRIGTMIEQPGITSQAAE